jgi:hypothetical protein
VESTLLEERRKWKNLAELEILISSLFFLCFWKKCIIEQTPVKWCPNSFEWTILLCCLGGSCMSGSSWRENLSPRLAPNPRRIHNYKNLQAHK